MDTIAPRDGNRPLAFTGDCIGKGTSFKEDSTRWSEVEIWRTEGHGYVIITIGKSTHVGEKDRCWAEHVETPEKVIQFLTRSDDDGVEYLTRMARHALLAASDVDDRIRDTFVERVQ